MTKIKICGLSTPETITAAIECGADLIGLVFYPPSPRAVDIETAAYLTSFVPGNVQKVGLFVDPDDTQLQNTLNEVPLDMIQVHGSETPERCDDIKQKFSVPVIKSLAIETKEDIDQLKNYDDIVDWFLLDAKGEELPGGNGIAFDWSLLSDFSPSKPWLLAGGLTADNVMDAINMTNPTAVDVSSGVESQKGVKDADKIRAFIRAVKQA